MSRQSLATPAFVTSPSTLAVSGVISSIEPRASQQVHPSIPPSVSSSYVTSASSSIVVCPLRPKKGDSLSDPSSFGLQKFANSASSNQFPQVTLEVIRRSFSSYESSSSVNLCSPHRRPRHSSSGFNSCIQSSPAIFFSSLVSICLITPHRFRSTSGRRL